MAEPQPHPGSATGMPRWVKIFGVVLIALILALVISLIAGVRHGPGLHSPSDRGSHTPPVEHGP